MPAPSSPLLPCALPPPPLTCAVCPSASPAAAGLRPQSSPPVRATAAVQPAAERCEPLGRMYVAAGEETGGNQAWAGGGGEQCEPPGRLRCMSAGGINGRKEWAEAVAGGREGRASSECKGGRGMLSATVDCLGSTVDSQQCYRWLRDAVRCRPGCSPRRRCPLLRRRNALPALPSLPPRRRRHSRP